MYSRLAGAIDPSARYEGKPGIVEAQLLLAQILLCQAHEECHGSEYIPVTLYPHHVSGEATLEKNLEANRCPAPVIGCRQFMIYLAEARYGEQERPAWSQGLTQICKTCLHVSKELERLRQDGAIIG